MAAKKDKMIPSEKERKRALKYATPAGTGRMWVTVGIAFIIFGIVYSANNDSRHRRKIYIYKDIIEPLIMSVEFLNKEIKKQNHAP